MDPLAVYGAVTGSAGLVGLAYQAWSTHKQEEDRLIFTLDYFLRETGHAGDDHLEPGVNVGVVNQSKHAVFINGGGIEQEEPEVSDCSCFTEAVELGPRRRYEGFWIAEWWIESEGIDLGRPIRGYVALEDGSHYRSDWQVLRPPRTDRHVSRQDI